VSRLIPNCSLTREHAPVTDSRRFGSASKSSTRRTDHEARPDTSSLLA
jgi:hypothetical protein